VVDPGREATRRRTSPPRRYAACARRMPIADRASSRIVREICHVSTRCMLSRETLDIAANIRKLSAVRHQGGLRSRGIVKRNRCGCSERPFARPVLEKGGTRHSALRKRMVDRSAWNPDRRGWSIPTRVSFQRRRSNTTMHFASRTRADERGINQPADAFAMLLLTDWKNLRSRIACLSSASDGSAAFINPMDF